MIRVLLRSFDDRSVKRDTWRDTMGSGLHEASDAIRERVGLDAHYAPFKPPRLQDAPRPRGQSLGLLLWGASLVLLIAVLVLAMLVALGL
jgi:hypothetical protein